MNDKHEIEKELSTSTLAAILGKNSQALFHQLAEMGLIVRNANTWDLTDAGKLKGGFYKTSDKFGKYIVWPVALKDELEDSHSDADEHLLTATAI